MTETLTEEKGIYTGKDKRKAVHRGSVDRDFVIREQKKLLEKLLNFSGPVSIVTRLNPSSHEFNFDERASREGYKGPLFNYLDDLGIDYEVSVCCKLVYLEMNREQIYHSIREGWIDFIIEEEGEDEEFAKEISKVSEARREYKMRKMRDRMVGKLISVLGKGKNSGNVTYKSVVSEYDFPKAYHATKTGEISDWDDGVFD